MLHGREKMLRGREEMLRGREYMPLARETEIGASWRTPIFIRASGI